METRILNAVPKQLEALAELQRQAGFDNDYMQSVVMRGEALTYTSANRAIKALKVHLEFVALKYIEAQRQKFILEVTGVRCSLWHLDYWQIAAVYAAIQEGKKTPTPLPMARYCVAQMTWLPVLATDDQKEAIEGAMLDSHEAARALVDGNDLVAIAVNGKLYTLKEVE